MADDRLIEIVAELLTELQQFRKETNENFEKLETKVSRLEEQQAKTNLGFE